MREREEYGFLSWNFLHIILVWSFFRILYRDKCMRGNDAKIQDANPFLLRNINPLWVKALLSNNHPIISSMLRLIIHFKKLLQEIKKADNRIDHMGSRNTNKWVKALPVMYHKKFLPSCQKLKEWNCESQTTSNYVCSAMKNLHLTHQKSHFYPQIFFFDQIRASISWHNPVDNLKHDVI